jgi:hypothetical protein
MGNKRNASVGMLYLYTMIIGIGVITLIGMI